MYEQRFVNILSINDESQNGVSLDRESKTPQGGQMARESGKNRGLSGLRLGR
jgi:hypothetical protein